MDIKEAKRTLVRLFSVEKQLTELKNKREEMRAILNGFVLEKGEETDKEIEGDKKLILPIKDTRFVLHRRFVTGSSSWSGEHIGITWLENNLHSEAIENRPVINRDKWKAMKELEMIPPEIIEKTESKR